MRKSVCLSFLCACLIVIGCCSPLAAAADRKTTQENSYFLEEARQLEKLGLIRGDKDGNLMLGSHLKRCDLAIILSRLYREDGRALRARGTLSFRDVDPKAYYFPYILWASEKGLLQGIRSDTFGADQNVTIREFEVVLLRVLGYDEEAKNWELVEDISAAIGLSDGLKTSENRAITRGEMAKFIANALSTQKKGSTLKLRDIFNLKMAE